MTKKGKKRLKLQILLLKKRKLLLKKQKKKHQRMLTLHQRKKLKMLILLLRKLPLKKSLLKRHPQKPMVNPLKKQKSKLRKKILGHLSILSNHGQIMNKPVIILLLLML